METDSADAGSSRRRRGFELAKSIAGSLLVDAVRRFTVPIRWVLAGLGLLLVVLLMIDVIEGWAAVAAWIVVVLAVLAALITWGIEWLLIRIINRIARPRVVGELDREAFADRLGEAGIPTSPLRAVLFAWRLLFDRGGLERRLRAGYESLRTDFPEVFDRP